MTYFEKDAILSGIGISRIGRRSGIPGRDLTMEAVRAAIADAGLVTPQPRKSTPSCTSKQRIAEPDSAPVDC
jgi:hypothetical protein